MCIRDRYYEKAAYEEAEHAAKFAELLGEVLSSSTKENLEARVAAEYGATEGKMVIAKKAKELGLDAIHDTVPVSYTHLSASMGQSPFESNFIYRPSSFSSMALRIFSPMGDFSFLYLSAVFSSMSISHFWQQVSVQSPPLHLKFL